MAQDQFIALVKAELDINSLEKDIGSLKPKSPIKIEIDTDYIQKQISQAIGNIRINNIGSQLGSQLGSSIGHNVNNQMRDILSDSVKQSITNITSPKINRYFKVTRQGSNEFTSEMEKLVSQWTDGKGKLSDIVINTRTSYDKDEEKNIERLHQATVTYTNDLNEVIKKTIAWRQIGVTYNQKGEEIPLRGFVEVAGQYSKSIDTVTKKTDTFTGKQKNASAALERQLQTIESRISDKSTSKPINDQSHIDDLNRQAQNIREQIDIVSNASRDSFVDANNEAKALISTLENMERQYRNAESVATSLRTKDTDTVRQIELEKLNQFEQKVIGSNVSFDEIIDDGLDKVTVGQKFEELRQVLSGEINSENLTRYLNDFDIFKAKISAKSQEISTQNSNEKLSIKTDQLNSKINDLQRINPLINNFKTEINGAEVSVESLLTDLSQINSQGDLGVVTAKFNAYKEAAKAAGIQVSEVVDKVSDLSSISEKLNDKSIDLKIEKLSSKYESFKESGIKFDDTNIEDTYNNIKKLQTSVTELNNKLNDGTATNDDISNLSKQYDELNQEVRKFSNELGILGLRYNDTIQGETALRKSNQVEDYCNKNTRALKKYGTELRNIQEQYRNATTGSELKKIDAQFGLLKSRISAEGLAGNSYLGRLIEAGKSIGNYVGVSTIVGYGVDAVKQMAVNTYNLDTAITSLYKVTDETDKRYSEFVNNAAKSSKDLGRKLSGYITQTAEWSKLGYSLDDNEQLSKLSSIYANVGEVSDEVAVADMVTAMKAFNIETTNAVTIIDSLNALGNNFAVSSADLGEGLSTAASSLAAANNDMNQSLAMITGMSEITQNSNEASNALKILSMRIRGYDEETEGYTNSVEELEGSIASLTKTAQTPGGISLFTDATKQTYKDTYTLMEEISRIYDDLSDKSQAELLEVLAGKNRGNQISALLQAFQSGQVQKAYETAINSAGSAQEEQDRWMLSLEAKLQTLYSSFENLSRVALNADIFKVLIDSGTTLLDIISSIISGFNAISSLGGNISSSFGAIGAVGGLVMNKLGLGKICWSSGTMYRAPLYKVA